jgi:hypothetical protein
MSLLLARNGHGATFLHYLRSFASAGTIDASVVVARMKQMPVNDFNNQDVRVRQDGVCFTPSLRLLRCDRKAARRKRLQANGRRRVFIHCAIIAKPPQTHSAYVKLAPASLLMTCRQPSSLSAPTERNARLSRFFCMSDTFFSSARPRSVR